VTFSIWTLNIMAFSIMILSKTTSRTPKNWETVKMLNVFMLSVITPSVLRHFVNLAFHQSTNNCFNELNLERVWILAYLGKAKGLGEGILIR